MGTLFTIYYSASDFMLYLLEEHQRKPANEDARNHISKEQAGMKASRKDLYIALCHPLSLPFSLLQ
jgi:hypothetical protein